MAQTALEIAHVAAPEELLGEIDLRDDDAVFFCSPNQQVATQSPHSALRPIIVDAADGRDQIHLVLSGSGAGECGMAIHDGHGDDLGTVGGQASGDLWNVDVEADHHADLADSCLEHRELAP